MLKTLKDRWPLIALLGVSTLSVGMVVALLKTTDAFGPTAAVVTPQFGESEAESAVLALATESPESRSTSLRTLADTERGLEGARAQYLLATDLIHQNRGGSALALLDNLEARYPAMAPYILLKRGQAETASSQTEAAAESWNKLLSEHPQSGAAAEALYQLGNQPTPGAATSWERLLTELPGHPRSVEVAFKQLPPDSPDAAADKAAVSTPPATAGPKTNLDELTLLKLVAEHGIGHPDYVATLDRLTKRYSSNLTPEDWAMVGFGYWETQNYGKAGIAYSRAPESPVALYRSARGQELGGKTTEAIAAYQALNQTFPDTPETATGLLKLANLVPKPLAMSILDQVRERFPVQAAEALLLRAEILEGLKSPDSAKQARTSVLTQYSDSAAAAKLRLKRAEETAKTGDYDGAIQWVEELVTAAPADELAARAGFWLGKWSLGKNRPDAARSAFEQVIRNHPASYYAWRSAVHLDWPVGDFDTVRSMTPEIALPPQRSRLPAGSKTLQELYLLGQDQAAWGQWQLEYLNPQTPAVAEQFTDGVLRLGVNDNLEGIFMVSSLAWRDRPEEKSQYQQLKSTPNYWQAIYPFPFSALIQGWAQQRKLNPLLVTALIRQESRFQPEILSVVGAVGLMQVMPETADWVAEQTGESDFTLNTAADNVKLGTWYLDYTHREYNGNSLFAIASYNAGPGNVDDWIAKKDFTNADEFVENIPFPETRGYVDSVFGGYWNYLRLYNPDIAAKVAAL